MTSNNHSQCYVWIWLPGYVEPVVAGQLQQIQDRMVFNYGQSYLKRHDAIAIYDQELPLKAGAQEVKQYTSSMPGCIRDAAPDAWGRRVILNQMFGARGHNIDPGKINEITYLLNSSSDRIGALDFQTSADNYQDRSADSTSLEELQQAAELVEKGKPLTSELSQAIRHGTSIGGARPKALIDDNHQQYIAKFSSSTDIYNVIKAEFIAMRLAYLCGLDVANVTLTQTLGKDVLLIERFDRTLTDSGWTRHILLSALTLLGLDEMTARYATYPDLAEIIRQRFVNPRQTLRELFSRMVFNVLCGNTDDHARNHAAFWDGQALTLTPAYDICPQMRTGRQASQAMAISEQDRSSSLINCLHAAPYFMLAQDEANDIIHSQINTIRSHWHEACDQAQLSSVDRSLFWNRLFLNQAIFEGFR